MLPREPSPLLPVGTDRPQGRGGVWSHSGHTQGRCSSTRHPSKGPWALREPAPGLHAQPELPRQKSGCRTCTFCFHEHQRNPTARQLRSNKDGPCFCLLVPRLPAGRPTPKCPKYALSPPLCQQLGACPLTPSYSRAFSGASMPPPVPVPICHEKYFTMTTHRVPALPGLGTLLRLPKMSPSSRNPPSAHC